MRRTRKTFKQSQDVVETLTSALESTAPITIGKGNNNQRFIECQVDGINSTSLKHYPMHIYSDLPNRLEDVWTQMRKRKISTFMDYITSFSKQDNRIVFLTKRSTNTQLDYIVITTKKKYDIYRDSMYRNYNINKVI
jgi:hypothetical protein